MLEPRSLVRRLSSASTDEARGGHKATWLTASLVVLATATLAGFKRPFPHASILDERRAVMRNTRGGRMDAALRATYLMTLHLRGVLRSIEKLWRTTGIVATQLLDRQYDQFTAVSETMIIDSICKIFLLPSPGSAKVASSARVVVVCSQWVEIISAAT